VAEAKLQTPLKLELLGKLATGGMATVWVARNAAEPERLIALKRIHRHLAKSGDFLSMFLDEIWMTGELAHANVVPLVGWGVDQDGPYMAMELVRGATLHALHHAAMAGGERLAPELAAYAAAEVARGLGAAHALCGSDGRPLGLVHRDLTPSNVLVGFDGSVKITDFGIAQAARKIANTSVGVLKGKVHFMSPEYIRGESLDGRSDLYSLGVMLFELLSGKKPFAEISDETALLKAAAHAEPPPVREHAAVDAELAAIVDRLRAKRPSARFDSGEAAAAELDAWLAARGHTAQASREALAAFARRHGRTQGAQVDAIVGAKVEPSAVVVVEEEPPHTRTVAPPRPAGEPVRIATTPAAAERTPTGTRALAVPIAEPARPTESIDLPAVPPRRMWPMGAVAAAVVIAAGLIAITRSSTTTTTTATTTATATATTTATTTATATATTTATATAIATAIATASALPSAVATASSRPSADVSVRRPIGAGIKRRPRSCTPADFDYPNCAP
jgi:eukaryotic-like serine/threonine-protein kinase